MSHSNEPEDKTFLLAHTIVSKDEATTLLNKQGWIMIRSTVLNDIIFVAVDSKVKIPGNPSVVYTPSELTALKDLEPQDALFLHGMKVAYGGVISIPSVIKNKPKEEKNETQA